MNLITEDQVREIAASINHDDIEAAGIAEPSYNNGMSDSVRGLLSDEVRLESRINEVLSVLT